MKSFRCSKCGFVMSPGISNCKNCSSSAARTNSSESNLWKKLSSGNPDDFNIKNLNSKERRNLGLSAALLGLFAFVFNWMSLIYSNSFYRSAAFLSPNLILLGLAFFLIKTPEAVFSGELKDLSVKWWLVLGSIGLFAVICGLLNLYLSFNPYLLGIG